MPYTGSIIWSRQMRTRVDLAKYCERRDMLNILEIGTHQGMLARQLLDVSSKVQLTTIDPYMPYLEKDYDRSVDRQIALYTLKCHILDNRCIIEQVSSQEFFFNQDPYHPFDLIYIDGAHDKHNVYLDLEISWNYLTPNGILAGHDFDLIEVASTVTEFSHRYNRQLYIIPEYSETEHPSWYLFKSISDEWYPNNLSTKE